MVAYPPPAAPKQHCKCVIDLELTPRVRIPVKIFVKCKKVYLPGFQEVSGSKRKAASEALTQEMKTAGEDFEHPQTRHLITFGADSLDIDEQTYNAIGCKSEKCLQILDLVRVSEVPAELFVGATDVVMYDEKSGNEKAFVFSCLIHALLEKGYALVVRFVHRENAEPKLMLAVPKCSAKSGIELFHMIQLSYGDETISINSADACRALKPDHELVRNFESLIDHRMLSSEDGSNDFQLTQMHNPDLFFFYHYLGSKASVLAGNKKWEAKEAESAFEGATQLSHISEFRNLTSNSLSPRSSAFKLERSISEAIKGRLNILQ